MKFIKNALVSGLVAGALLAGGPLWATQHDHSAMGQMQKMFMEMRDIDGYQVSFHVMEAAGDMNHGGSHNVMVKVEQDGQQVEGLKLNSKVKFADGTEQSKMPMKMGDWYTAGYDLGDAGDHQLMVLFMTPDGKKHFGGVHYPTK